MQLHLTLKEIVQQPWEQEKCHLSPGVSWPPPSVPSPVPNCVTPTGQALLTTETTSTCAPSWHIKAVPWNHLMLSWLCLGSPSHFHCQLLSSLSRAAAVTGLSAYSYDLILFLFSQSLKLSLSSRTLFRLPLCWHYLTILSNGQNQI